MKSIAASALLDQFLMAGTRFLEETVGPNRLPAYRTVERARVIEKFCQGLREKKFSSNGLCPAAKAGAFRGKAVTVKNTVTRTKRPKKKGKKPKYTDDYDEYESENDDDWTPKKTGKKKKAKAGETAVQQIRAATGETPPPKKLKKESKTKVAKKQSETAKVTKKKSETKSKKRSNSCGLVPGTSSIEIPITQNKKSPRGDLDNPQDKGTETSSVKEASATKSTPAKHSTPMHEPGRPNSESSPFDPNMRRLWSSSYSGPHFYAYPHYSPYFHPPEHYPHGGNVHLDPRFENRRTDASLNPDLETPQPVAISPAQTLGDAAHVSAYDSRIVSPMEPDLPNNTYWRKRVRLDSMKRNDKEILAAFMESYEDCKKYAHEMCKKHQETVVERFPVDDEAENLVRVLRPSKFRKIGSEKVSPMPVFHDSYSLVRNV